VFRAIIDAGYSWVAVVGLVSSVVAAFYYLRLIKVMWFDQAVGATDKPPLEAKTIGLGLALFSFPVVLIALIWLYPAAGKAARAFGLA
jgi:NADH-quinone oxidoreductase subunit N